MGDLTWTQHKYWTYPLTALRYHAIVLGASGSGKTETLQRLAYGARKAHQMQVIYLDAKGETKREEEEGEDNAARFIATMRAAGARNIAVFPSLFYDGWKGTPLELKNRLMSIVDFSESAYYGDVAANALDLALNTPMTPRSSKHFLANLHKDRLKGIYAQSPDRYRRVLQLDDALLQQVEMRYQGFFTAMDGQLDGTLDYANVDAVYLRVRGFTLRNEAPRLGRFLMSDFMHYLAERRRPGTLTLLIIDEFNALRMREEASVLFEQARSFGACLVISAQGYSGLGPHEYADRLLDACSTYILHACSDPFQVSRRAGKRLRLDTSWSEIEGDAQNMPRKSLRPVWDWRVREQDVIQQNTGQAFWMYHGHAQQVLTAQIPIGKEDIQAAWREIRYQEEVQYALSDAKNQRIEEQEQIFPAPLSIKTPQHKKSATKTRPVTCSKIPAGIEATMQKPEMIRAPKSSEQRTPTSTLDSTSIIPQPDPSDDEPDRL